MPSVSAPGAAQQCEYDAWNRLIRVSANNKPLATYEYDGLGRLAIEQTYNSEGNAQEWRRFIFDPAGRLLQELVRDPEPMGKTFPAYNFKISRNYVWGPRGAVFCDHWLLLFGVGVKRHYIQEDEQGSVAAIVSGGDLSNDVWVPTRAAVQERYHYDPSGGLTILCRITRRARNQLSIGSCCGGPGGAIR